MNYIPVTNFHMSINETSYVNPNFLFVKLKAEYSTIVKIKFNDINEFTISTCGKAEDIIKYFNENNEIFIEDEGSTFMFHADKDFIKLEISNKFSTSDLWFENNDIVKTELQCLFSK